MKRLRNIVINYLTKNLLKAVTIEEVLQISGKDWLVNNRKLSAEEILVLKEEAKEFRECDLWKLLKKELKYGITLQRYDKATTFDDTIFGKAQAYNFSLIEKFIQNISSL